MQELSEGRVLALLEGEYHVSRAVVPLIVLALTAGQNVALLCDVWCPAPDDAVSCQHHSTLGPTVTTDHCNTVVTPNLAVGRDDVRGGTPARDTDHAVVVPRFLSDTTSILDTGDDHAEQLSPLGAWPLAVTLRI